MLKQNDTNNELLKQENLKLLIKLKSFEELKVAVDRNEIENVQLKNTLKEINQKYESLRDIDSPVKEVSQMKKIIKQNDLNIASLKEENYELLIKNKSLGILKIEISQLKSSLKDITEKYESLRDIDSPIKEVSQMKKLMKQNDENLQILKDENTQLKIKLETLEESSIQYEDSKSQSLRDLDSPVKEVSQMKKIMKENDIKLESFVKEKEELAKKEQDNEEIIARMEEKIEVLECEIKLNSNIQEKNKEFKSATFFKQIQVLEMENCELKLNAKENRKSLEELEKISKEKEFLTAKLKEILENYEILKNIDQENPDFKPLIQRISQIEEKNELFVQENIQEKQNNLHFKKTINELNDSKEKLSVENQKLLEKNNHYIIQLEEVDLTTTQMKEISLKRPSPVQTKLNLEKEYKKINEELKARLNPLEIENEQLKKSLS